MVIVLHGGPAAVGEAAPIARGLADTFRVLEPWQRGSGGDPLSVSRHVADLHELVQTQRAAGVIRADTRPALVGESWGAMLALAYAAAHPDSAGPVVLVGCGTFDRASRERMHAILEERKDDGLRGALQRLPEEIPGLDERLKQRQKLTRGLYLYDPIAPTEAEEGTGRVDARAHTETWQDMLRLQEEGVYPAAFAAIKSPVLMLHGTYDPHPGQMIRASLAPYLPQLEYREWDHCGHQPWLEKGVREEFFAVLRNWLARHSTR
jgi:pimeloyl-ACP methyl ester carboxylesterase